MKYWLLTGVRHVVPKPGFTSAEVLKFFIGGGGSYKTWLDVDLKSDVFLWGMWRREGGG